MARVEEHSLTLPTHDLIEEGVDRRVFE